ncbi:alpha/beta hydrolase [Cucumibacter marinus]|uniref:alpha/beta hydrolase n=1 Tax=Cucumibacter marinus TaxID=1121252 RepID=UPI000403F443|nr:alpha/beta hydrolase [Cucumibacter marinus]
MTIDPELDPFVKGLDVAWPQSPITLPLDVWRERVETLAAAARPPHAPGLITASHRIPGSNGRTVELRVYTPDAAKPLPALIYFHGGGWVVGSIDSHDIVTAALSAQTPAIVISVDYARAPEHPFPAAFEDAATALKWVNAHAADLGIAPRAIAVGGDSAGANLSAALSIHYRDHTARPAGQLLFYPCLDTDFLTASYIGEAEAPFLKAAEMRWFWDQYCPEPDMRRDPRAVPMRVTDAGGLPPALIIAAEHDPLREDAHRYAEKLEKAGSKVTLRPGRGLIHGFLRAAALSAAVRAEYDAAASWLQGLRSTQ